jgi:hypothetical protein
MMCYKDMSFCSAAPRCENAPGCWRNFDHIEKERANAWALDCGMVGDKGSPAPLVAYMDFSLTCPQYISKE